MTFEVLGFPLEGLESVLEVLSGRLGWTLSVSKNEASFLSMCHASTFRCGSLSWVNS